MIQVYGCYGMSFYTKALEKMGFKPYGDLDAPTMFLGTYTENDVRAMVEHRGPRYIFWNGSDAIHLARHPGWQDILRGLPATHAAHHDAMATEVANLIDKPVEVSPTFFHETKDYPVSFVPSKPAHFFMSAHAGRHIEYGIDVAMEVFDTLPKDFHLDVYGDPPSIATKPRNVTIRGRYPESVMDLQTKNMHGALRLNKHDGTSQIVIKSILWGQWPVVTTDYAMVPHLLTAAAEQRVPNTETIPRLNVFIDRLRRAS